MVDHDSRLDRAGELAAVRRRFAARRVALVVASENLDLTSKTGRVLAHVKALINEEARLETARLSREGLISRFLAGWHVGGQQYGYRMIPVWPDDVPVERRERANRIGTRIEIHPEEAEWVRWMYGRYAEGWGLARIAGELNRRTAQPRIASAWGTSSVRLVLTQTRYRGEWVWNRSEVTLVPDDELTARQAARAARGKPVRRRLAKPDGEHVRMQHEDLRIVSDALWFDVQARLERAGRGPRAGRRSSAPLAGLIRCRCGGAIVRITNVPPTGAVLGCGRRRRAGSAVCDNARMRGERFVVAALIERVEQDLLAPAALETVARTFAARSRGAARNDPGEAARQRQRLQEAEQRARRLADAIAKGAAFESVVEALAATQSEIDEVRRRLSVLEGPVVPRGRSMIGIGAVLERGRAALEDLRAGGTRSIGALHRLLERVTVVPAGDDWSAGWALEISYRVSELVTAEPAEPKRT